MMLSTLSSFFIWRVPSTNGAVLGLSCVFSAVTVTVFGSLDVIVMNIYDVQVRYNLRMVWVNLPITLVYMYV